MRRLSYWIIVLPLIIFLLIAIFLWRGLQQDPHEIPSPLINHPAPSFSGSSLFDPQRQLTQKEFKGHITLLNVFATWCVACQAEHPTLMDIHHQTKLVLIGLNYKDSRSEVLPWLKKLGNPYHEIIYDPKGNIGINFGVYGTPETFIIDQQGVVRYKYLGPISAQAWQEEILPQVQKLESKSVKIAGAPSLLQN